MHSANVRACVCGGGGIIDFGFTFDYGGVPLVGIQQ